MRKRIVSGLLLTLLLLGLLTLAFNIQPVNADPTTIIVPDDYPAIQEAIDHAYSGDTIFVRAGTYYEHVIVYKSLTLIGEDPSTTIIDGSGTGKVIHVTAGNVVISSFTITNSGQEYWDMGIFLDGIGVTGCAIINNNVSNNGGFGIFACWANDNDISNNLFMFNGRNGIRVDVSRNILTNNIVNYNGWLGTYEGSGIHLYVAFDCLIEGNTASNNRQCGIDVQGMSRNITIRDNTAEDNGYDGIFHYGSLACSTEANTISNNRHNGIFIEFSNDTTICHNTITSNNWNGILLSTSDGNKICDNIATNNYVGIRLDRSDGNTIRGNTVTNNRYGIYLWTSNNNTISGNNIIANNGNGIWLVYFSEYNNVSGNNIVGNYYGIGLYESSNNGIYHNNLVDNADQVYSRGSINTWDDGYPSGGNYWSDHITVDDCCGVNQDEPGSDGIVDEPYIVDYYNRDHYPLVEPWSPVISASIDVDPDTLNIHSRGQWITAYIQLPEGYNAEDIDATTILLNETIQPVLDPKYEFVTNSSEYLVDHNGDGILERMVKFNRTEVNSWIYDDLGIQYGDVVIEITGELYDGTPFEGTDMVKVLLPGDADDDGDVDLYDLYILSRCHGVSTEDLGYNPLADFNEEGYINSEDLLILSENYGKTAV